MKKILFSILFFSFFNSNSQMVNALDTSFGNNGIVSLTGTYINGIKVLDDGKILVLLSANNGATIIKLLPDGSLDNTFNASTAYISSGSSSDQTYPLDMISQSDGKLIAIIRKVNYYQLVRFNIDGTVDTTFGNNGYVENCFLQDNQQYTFPRIAINPVNGNIFISANKVSTSYEYSPLIVSYTSIGTLNTNFNINGSRLWQVSFSSYSKEISDIIIDPLGKIIAAGCRRYDGVHVSQGQDDWLFRLNTDGSDDMSFSSDGNFCTDVGNFYFENNNLAYTLLSQTDGSVLVAGKKGSYPNMGIFMIYQVDSSGNLTQMPISYPTASNSNNNPWIIKKDNDGKIVLGGSLSPDALFYNGGFGILRINADFSVDSTFGINGWVTYLNQNYNFGLNQLAIQPDNKILATGNYSGQCKIARYMNTSLLDFEEFESEKKLKLFTNSNDVNSLSIFVLDYSLLGSEFDIIDLSGRVLSKASLSSSNQTVDISSLTSGIYLLNFDKYNISLKFFKY